MKQSAIREESEEALLTVQTNPFTKGEPISYERMLRIHSMEKFQEDATPLLETQEGERDEGSSFEHRRKKKQTWYRESILSALFCLIGVISLGMSVGVYRVNRRQCALQDSSSVMNQKLKDTSFYSPVLDQLEIPLIEKKSFGAFFDDVDKPSLFRQPPSPEVDAAWDDLEWIGRFYVTGEEVIKLGKDPSMTVRSPRYPGKHIAIISVFHELHCLNSLRKSLYMDHYFGQKRTDEVYWSHIYHCIDTIRQSLMCSANVDVTTYNWVETQTYPYADLSKNQVCRDFDAIKKWQNETMKDLNDVPVFRQGGEIELPRPKKLKQIHEASSRSDGKSQAID